MNARAAVAVIFPVAVLAVPRAAARPAEDGVATPNAPLDVSAPPVSVPPPNAPSTWPDLRPRLVVEDAAQLPRLMQKDPKFAAEAQSLADRRTASFAAGAAGVLGWVALSIAGANHMDGPPPGDPNFGQMPDGPKYFLAGVAALAVGGFVAAIVYPKRAEVVELVNGWNIAHPDEQLLVQPVIIAQGPPDSAGPEPLASPSPPAEVGPRLVVPATGGPPVLTIPVGAGVYLPVTGGPPVSGVPVD